MLGHTYLIKSNIWDSLDSLDLGNSFAEVEDCISDLLGSRTSVRSIVLDAKVFVRTAWVVRCCQQDGPHAGISLFSIESPDKVRDCRGREKTVLTDNDFGDAISSSDSQDFLDGDVIPVPAISRDNELLVLTWHNAEYGGDEVF